MRAEVVNVIGEAIEEMVRQDLKWGEQSHAHVMNPNAYQVSVEAAAKAMTDRLAAEGRLTWAHILCEEIAETLAAPSLEEMYAELVQTIAVAVQWASALREEIHAA